MKTAHGVEMDKALNEQIKADNEIDKLFTENEKLKDTVSYYSYNFKKT